MPFVSNAGPVLSFARAGMLDVLRQVLGEIFIPNAVAEELGHSILDSAPWLRRHEVHDRILVESLPQRLHSGECEALVLAKELDAVLLIDDREARKEAHKRGIPHLGSLRVLKDAKERGVIAAVKPALDELIATGTFIGKPLYHAFLNDVRES